jgi:hypothetical protein
MSKVLLITVIVLLVLAAIVGLIAFGLTDKSGQEFSSELLLHVFAEFLAIALGFAIPLLIASRLLGEKLNILARPIVELVARLRIDGKISRESARSCVKCAVTLISEESFKEGYSLSVWPPERICDVCDLKIDLQLDDKCQHCGLSGHIWRLPKEPNPATP